MDLLSLGWKFRLYSNYLEEPFAGYYIKEIPFDQYPENNLIVRYYPESSGINSNGEECIKKEYIAISNLSYVELPDFRVSPEEVLDSCLEEAYRRQSLDLKDMLLGYIQPCYFKGRKAIGFITEDEYYKVDDNWEIKPEYIYDNCDRLQNLTFSNLFKIVDVLNESFPGLLKFDASKIDRQVFIKAEERLKNKLTNHFKKVHDEI